MIDWFIVLSPLAVLPLILLAGFVGCTLDRSGDPRDHAPSFRYPAGLNLNLASMTVKMTVSANADSRPQTIGPLSSVSGDINPKGDVLYFPNLDHIWGEDGVDAHYTADCECDIVVGAGAALFASHQNICTDKSHYEFADFQLLQVGGSSGYDPQDYMAV